MSNLPHLLKRAHFAFRQVLDTMLAEYDLTSAQLDVLMRVASCECAEHRTLLQEMEVASPTLTKLVNSLVDSGYLERQISPEDARVKVFTLTEQGRELQAHMMAMHHDVMGQFLHGFSPAEQLLLVELLQRLIENIEAVEA